LDDLKFEIEASLRYFCSGAITKLKSPPK